MRATQSMNECPVLASRAGCMARAEHPQPPSYLAAAHRDTVESSSHVCNQVPGTNFNTMQVPQRADKEQIVQRCQSNNITVKQERLPR